MQVVAANGIPVSGAGGSSRGLSLVTEMFCSRSRRTRCSRHENIDLLYHDRLLLAFCLYRDPLRVGALLLGACVSPLWQHEYRSYLCER